MHISSKTVVVTGAGSGIGRELTLLLLRKGARVAGVDINPASLAETGRLANVGENRYQAFPLDITDQTAVGQLPAAVADHFGVVDGLINNAGIIQPFKPVTELSLEEINRVLNVNFYGTVYLTKAFLPLLLARPEAHIVNISSMGGFVAVPGQTVYGAAKAAVKVFTEGLYAELTETNVQVTVVFPGAIATNITQNSGLGNPSTKVSNVSSRAAERLKPMPPEKAAGRIVDAVERNAFRVVIGTDARVLDWLYRFNPRFAINFIQKKMKSLRSS